MHNHGHEKCLNKTDNRIFSICQKKAGANLIASAFITNAGVPFFERPGLEPALLSEAAPNSSITTLV